MIVQRIDCGLQMCGIGTKDFWVVEWMVSFANPTSKRKLKSESFASWILVFFSFISELLFWSTLVVRFQRHDSNCGRYHLPHKHTLNTLNTHQSWLIRCLLVIFSLPYDRLIRSVVQYRWRFHHDKLGFTETRTLQKDLQRQEWDWTLSQKSQSNVAIHFIIKTFVCERECVSLCVRVLCFVVSQILFAELHFRFFSSENVFVEFRFLIVILIFVCVCVCVCVVHVVFWRPQKAQRQQ
jgi:hypothetical protein